MSVLLDRRFWRWSRTNERPIARYMRMRARFGRRYSLVLALGFDGCGT